MTETPRVFGVPLAELRRDRTSVKWRAFDEDVLPLWVAEMDAAPCPDVVEAATAAVRRGDTGYSWGPDLVEAVRGFAADEWGWTFEAQAAHVVADVMIGVAEVLRLVTDEGGPVVVSPPVYEAFFGFIDAIGRERVEAPLTADGRLDPAALEAAFVQATAGGVRAAYLLCNPQNPTGTVHSPDELRTLADLAERYDVQVVSDEIHAPLTYASSTFTPYLTAAGGERGIALLSASKSWNLAGLRAAVAVAGPEARDVLERLHPVHGHGANHVGVTAQVAAFTRGRAWHRRALAELDVNRHLVADLVAEHLPGVRMRLPEATYLAWLDCRDLGLGDDPARVFRTRGRIALSSGPRYGDAGRGFARLNFATSPEILTEAVHRMARSLD